MRVNSQKTAKPALLVGPGDTLTFPQARIVRVIRVMAVGTRRGPASEARLLYKDLAPDPPAAAPAASTPRPNGGARPTKKDRRTFEQQRGATSRRGQS